MQELFLHQLDYIFFFYGLSFFVMALVCFGMGRPGRSHLPWSLLGMFGATHGLNEWLDLFAFSIGDTPLFSLARILILLTSFMFLAEFARAGMGRIGAKTPGWWMHIVLAGFAGMGCWYGLEGLNAASRYAVGLVGGLFCAYLLVKAYRINQERESAWLAATGLILGLYALATGLIVPYAPFFPADTVNYVFFSELTGMPVQFVRGVLALMAAVSIISYHRAIIKRAAAPKTGIGMPTYSFKPLSLVLAIVVAGWFVTEGVGRRDVEEFKHFQLNLARTLASSLDVETVQALSAGTDTPDEDVYRHIRGHMLHMRRENPDFLSVSIRTVRGGRLILLSDGKEEGTPGHLGYGNVLKRQNLREIAEYSRGVSTVEEIHEARSYDMFRFKVPIFSPGGGVMAQLAVDIDASSAERFSRQDRLAIIVITCVLSLLCISVFIAWFRTRELIAQSSELRLAALVADSEKRLKAITSAIGEGVLQLDASGAVVFVNPEAERLLGYREDELLGLDGHDTLHHHSADGTSATREDCPSLKVLATGKTFHTDEEIFTRKDGSSFPVSYVSAPVFQEGKVIGVVVAFHDVTDRKAAEHALRESERSYRTLSENLPGIVYRITLGENKGMQFFNEMVLPMTGYSVQELTLDRLCSFESHIVEDDLPRVLNAVNLAMMEGTAFQVEYRFRHKDGEIRYFLERGRSITGDDGKPAFIDGVVLDITERRRIENELYKFKFIVDGSGEEFYLVDSSGRFEYANEAACSGLGYSLEEFKSMTLSDIDPAYGEKEIKAQLDELRKRDLPLFETTHITKGGRRIPKEVKASRLEIDGREYVCSIVRDITDRKELERQRDDFFSIVTHDLKSPLTVIIAYADIILDEYEGKVPDEVYNASRSIKSSCDKVLRMVDDYLAISRLESGVIHAMLTRVDIKGVVREAGVTARGLVSGRKMDIRLEVDEGVLEALADRGYLLRALTNLVQNAVNYTPDGGTITLGCRADRLEGEDYAEIYVKDTGRGIDPAEREKIFEKYYRSPKTQGIKGSGLGLAIVKAIVDAHGGEVMLESEEGKGSTFRLLIPIAK